MAVKSFINLLLFYLLIINFLSINGNKLNTLKVLLPIFKDVHTNFTLEADDGCYRWSTSRQDIIQITPLEYNENLDCSNKAVVSCITKERVRNNALIIAENVYTGQYLRCDIIVDVIHSLTTITRTREILLEEDPVKILVRAYDNLGNEFSSLFGVQFNWRILGMGPSKDLIVLNFVKFDDSPYESPPGILALESNNAQGNVILVEGLKTGSAKISVSLPHEEYKTAQADEVQFSVIANLILLPQEVYLMMGDIISFKIFYLSYGKMEEIVLPNKQYYLKTESSDIAVADQSSSEVTGMALGQTRIILYDRNVIEADPSTRIPSAIVNVAEAAYIRLSVLPYSNWAIIVSHPHDIIAEVFTNTDRKINIGKGVELHTQISEPFHVHERAANGSWLSGWASKEGVAQAQGTLEAVTHHKYGRFVLNPPLTVQNELTIYAPITLSPAEVILPWDPIHRPKYEVQVVATGGDGKYLWTSTNNSIGMVAQTGMVRTHSYGYFEAAASMPRNHENRASAKFWILPPIRLEIVEYISEAEVGSTIFLHVALYAERPGRDGEVANQIPFTMCQELPFQIVLSNKRFSHEQKLNIMPVGISCANVALVGHNVGSSKVTVTYSLDGTHYQDSVSVSAFKPLSLMRPTEEIVLAVGSTIHLIFTGGPRPSASRPQDHHREVSMENSQTLSAEEVTDRHTIDASDEFYTVVKVVCRQLGETKMTLSIGNTAFIPNCKSKDSFITVPIICGKPRSISLQPKIKVADVGSCPMDLSTDRVVVQSNQDVELDVVVRDDCGRIFLNITSLQIDWNIESPKTGIALHKNGVFPDLSYLGTVPYGSRHYQVITPKAETGIIVVTPTLVGYRSDIIGKHRIKPESPLFIDADDETECDVSLLPITASVSLYLVDDTVVTPDDVTLYNHPANKKYLSVKQGSGYYELGLSVSAVADVEYQKATRQIVITPKEDGELKITLTDLCLASRPTTVNVNIVSVATIRVEMSDKVEINKCISCIVRLYDETDNLLNIPDMSMVNLQYTLLDKLASVVPAKPNNQVGGGEIHYTVKGNTLGDTKLVFTVSGRDPEVSSSSMDLQVFPPLKLYPRNGTLIIGAVLQYSSKGGPQPDSHIEYSVKHKNTAEVEPNGILKGLKLGTTTIMARAIGTNPTTGQKVIYTEDSVEVQIIPLTGIRISAPLSRFQTTTTVPMWATGSPDSLSPLIIGTREPPIKFDWAIDDANIATIAGVFLPTGVQYEPEDMISIRVTATSPGRTKLHLNATVPGEVAGYGKQSVIFTASLELEVFEVLELVSPKGICGRSILMAPNSHLNLLTNKDYESSLKYSLMEDNAATTTDLRRFGGGSVVSISETGKLESHSNFGYSTILISATDEFGLKQTLSTVVEVKPIHYMLMRINAKWEVPPPGPVVIIPLGAEFELRASYHDNSGVAFTAGISELKMRTSRFDLVKVKLGSDNSSVTVSAKKTGTTIVKIWTDGFRKTADYVKLHVQQVIQPQVTTVTSGDIICFHSPLASRLRHLGTTHWSSTEPHLLAVVDADNGIIQASGIRGGHAAVTHSLHPSAPFQMLVQPITSIYILPSVEQKSLVSSSKEVFRVPLVLRGGEADSGINNLIMGWDCKKKLRTLMFSTESIPFTCHIQFNHEGQQISDYSQYFSLISSFNPISGQYCCDIRPNLDGINMSTFATNITLWVVADGKEVISNRVQIPFIPALQFSKQIDMDESSSSHQLVISGLDYILDQVMIKAVDSSIISVVESSRPEKNVLIYNIELIDYHPKLDEMPDHMSIELKSPLTEQSAKILINARAIGNNFGRLSCPAHPKSPVGALFTSYPQFMVIIVSMAIIFAATYYIYLQCMQPVLRVDLQSTTANNISSMQQQMRMSPYLGRNCAANNANLNMPSQLQNASMFNNSAPVYGDPNSFYNTSPELRRNRRYI